MENLELWYRSNRGKFADGIPPVSFKSNGDALTNWTIYGYTSPNLFDSSATLVDSGIDRDTGEIVENSGSLTSDWIPYDSEKSLFMSGRRTIPAVASIIFAFYDSAKNYIDWVGVAFSVGAHSYEVTEIPISAAFFRVQFFDDGFSNVMINQGETALPYEPFGAVGDRTENLFPNRYDDVSGYLNDDGRIIPNSSYNTSIYVDVLPNTNYTFRFRSSYPSGFYFRCALYDASLNFIGWGFNSVTSGGGVKRGYFLTTDETAFVRLCYIKKTYASDAMLNVGTTALPYEPYGYKIPVTCGGETTNIYIGDTPLGTGQTVTSSSTGIAIPTIDGQNTFSVNTTIQPPKVTASAAKGMTESLMKYLEFKYGVLKMAGVQTGVFEISGTSPLSFTANGEPLRDWVIYGADGGVGDRTENLFDQSQTVDTDYYLNNSGNLVKAQSGDRFLAITIPVESSAQYTFSWVENILGSEDNTAYIRISFLKSNNSFIKRLVCNCEQESQNTYSFTTDNNTKYLDVRIDSETSERERHLLGVCMVKGDVAPEQYIPYGYRIPVTCNNETSILYFNEPLESGDSISFSDTGVEIPTIEGRNTLTVDTEVQPSEIKIKFKQ